MMKKGLTLPIMTFELELYIDINKKFTNQFMSGLLKETKNKTHMLYKAIYTQLLLLSLDIGKISLK